MPLLAFLVAVTYVPGLPSYATAGRWWIMGIGAALLLWGVRPDPGRGHWLGLSFLIWALFSTALWAVSGWDALGSLLHWVMAAGVFLVAAELPEDELRLSWLAFAAGVSVSALFAVVQWLGWHPVEALQPGSGLLLAWNAAGEAAVLALIGVVTYRVWWLLPGPAFIIWVTGERTPWLALGVAAATALYLYIPARRREILTGYVLLGVVSLVAWQFGWLGRWAYLADRLEIWGTVARNINPWGDGLEATAIAWQAYEYAHNEFLQYAFELGVGSLLLWGVVWHAFGANDVPKRAALAALLAQCCVWFPLHNPATLFMAAVLAGSLCGARVRLRNSKCACGVDRTRCLHESLAWGDGSLLAVNAGGIDLAFGQKHSVVARNLRGGLEQAGGAAP